MPWPGCRRCWPRSRCRRCPRTWPPGSRRRWPPSPPTARPDAPSPAAPSPAGDPAHPSGQPGTPARARGAGIAARSSCRPPPSASWPGSGPPWSWSAAAWSCSATPPARARARAAGPGRAAYRPPDATRPGQVAPPRATSGGTFNGANGGIQYQHDGRTSVITPVQTGTSYRSARLTQQVNSVLAAHRGQFSSAVPAATHQRAPEHDCPPRTLSGCVSRIAAGRTVLLGGCRQVRP